jgi:hypothetical protein
MVTFTWHVVAKKDIDLFRLRVPNSGPEQTVSRAFAFEVGVVACCAVSVSLN